MLGGALGMGRGRSCKAVLWLPRKRDAALWSRWSAERSGATTWTKESAAVSELGLPTKRVVAHREAGDLQELGPCGSEAILRPSGYGTGTEWVLLGTESCYSAEYYVPTDKKKPRRNLLLQRGLGSDADGTRTRNLRIDSPGL